LIGALEVLDLVVIAAAFVGALALGTADVTRQVLSGEGASLGSGSLLHGRTDVLLLGYLVFWHLTLRSLGLYRSYRLSPRPQEWRDLAVASAIGVVPLLAFTGPLLPATFGAIALAGLGAQRALLRSLARGIRRRGRNLRNIVLVGTADTARDVRTRLVRHDELGYRIADVVRVDDARAEHDTILARVADGIDHGGLDEVFVALPFDVAQGLMRELLALCGEQGVTVRLVTSALDALLARARVDEFDGSPVVTIFNGPPDSLSLAAKRLIDVLLSAVGLVLLAPMLAVLAILVKLDSSGPVFFAQERVGLKRRRFRLYKLRTMVSDAEQQQTALEALNEADGPVFKIRNDPRITRIGRWLRRTSLDELPQLWNVLLGEMSIVGPRPLPLRDVERIAVATHKRRFSVKPGITCLWQIHRREPRFHEWIKADLAYIDNWSLTLDLQILLKTIPAVLSRRGAY
jgi:exopolysaccharide biosynthesis polyprenyl glycosylphosphotransferase